MLILYQPTTEFKTILIQIKALESIHLLLLETILILIF
jgi:hypothetical protein